MARVLKILQTITVQYLFCLFLVRWLHVVYMNNHNMPVIGDSIYKNQHGFMEGKSTVTQSAQVFHEICQHNNSCGQVDTFYLDFYNAFGRVPYHLLLHKMKVYGFNGGILEWFTYYLSGRKQRVSISGSLSEWITSLQVFHRGLYWDPFCFYYAYTTYHFLPDLAKSHYLRMTLKVQR